MAHYSKGRRLLLCSAVAALIAGCNSGTGTDPSANAPAPSGDSVPVTGNKEAGRIVVVSNSTSPFWAAVELGMNDASKEFNVPAELIRNNENSVAGQIQRLEQVAAQPDIKGVAVSVINADAKGIIDKMTDLQKRNVHVVTFDSDGPKESRYAYIGANNVAAGEQAGKAAAALLPEGGKVVAFVGSMAAANARERIEGFKKGAGPKFEVVDVMEDQVDTTKARQNVTAAIQAHPDAKVLLGLWSYNAPAIAEEVQRAGKRDQYKIVTFDAEPNTITAMQKGLIDATVIQQPYEYGYQTVKLLNALNRKNEGVVKEMVPESRIVDVPCRTVITNPNGPIKPGGNVITFDEMMKYLNEKGLKGT